MAAGEGPVGTATDRPPTVAADPYPWPWDGALRAERLALVVCGGQRHFAERTVDAPSAVAAIDALAARVRSIGGLVVVLRHRAAASAPSGRPAFAPAPDDPAAALVVQLGTNDVEVECWGLDGFCGSSLELRLHLAGRDLLVLAGLGLEGPVHSTMRSANDRGFECLLLTDVSSPYDSALAERAVHSTTMSGGIFGAVAPLDAFVVAIGH